MFLKKAKGKMNLFAPKCPIEDFNTRFEYAWKSERDKPQISVEHYLVDWSIQNLSLLILEEHKSVSSPIFLMHSSNTSWYFEIYPNGLCNETQAVDLLLHRHDDEGPAGVGVTFRFGIFKDDDSVMWLKEKKIEDFRKWTSSFISLEDSERNTLSRNKFRYSEILAVRCEMYVTYAVPRYDLHLEPHEYDLVNFSFEFSKLMMAIEVTDYRVMVPGLNINVHKAILAARSTKFREILQDENSQTEVKLEGISQDSIRRVFRFMYSGNIAMALRGEPPSIGFYECSEMLAVVDLVSLLMPKSLHLRSVLRSQEFAFAWNIRNFMKRSAGKGLTIRSPSFGLPCEGAAKWYVTIDYERKSDQIKAFVETSAESNALHSILKISLLDGNGEMFNTRVTTRFRKPYEKFGFYEFLKNFSDQNTVHDLLINDTLRVHCELIFVVSEDVFEVHDMAVSEPLSFLDHCRNLSNHLSHLLETSDFSDVTIKARNNEMFKAHRAILFARSRKFYSKFLYYNRDDKILETFDVDPDLIPQMLKHAYSGVFPNETMSIENTLRLHKASDFYVFRQLTLITLHRLASQINLGNFFDLLVEGDNLKDSYLKEKCVKFVRRNAEKITEIADWDKYRRENSELSDFLMTVLNQETTKQNNLKLCM